MAALMALALCPAALAAEAEDVSVTYTGATVDASSLEVGETFYWTADISEYSGLFSAQWLIDYPEEYLTPIAASTTWSGGLSYQINQTWENGTAWSDTGTFVYNLTYEGQTGNNPRGEAGNWYTAVGMYLSSFSYWGVQMGGSFIRIKFRIDALPPSNLVQHDAGGDYISIPIVAYESTYYVVGSVIAPGEEYYHPHENVTTIPGKVYIRTSAPVSVHTVSFYGFGGALLGSQQVPHGTAASAPNAPQIVNNASGTYVFYGWDADFSSVTGNLEVHAVYLLLGDTDLNGQVTTSDALLILRAVNGLYQLSPVQICAGDVNLNNALDSSDALTILRFTMELVDSLL
jgi:hypothetical protein